MSDEVKWGREHYDNGQLMWETPYVNGQVHGILRYWYENGQLLWETPYVNEQVHGIKRGWYKNGQLAYETPYVNGERHGTRRVWDSDGKLWRIEKWHRDQRVIDLKLDPIPDGLMMEIDLITNEIKQYEHI